MKATAAHKLSNDEAELSRKIDGLGVSGIQDSRKIARMVIAAEGGDPEAAAQFLKRYGQLEKLSTFLILHRPKFAMAQCGGAPLALAIINLATYQKNMRMPLYLLKCPDELLFSWDARKRNMLSRIAQSSPEAARSIIYKGQRYLLAPNGDDTVTAHTIARTHPELLELLLVDREVANAPSYKDTKVLMAAYLNSPDEVKRLAAIPRYREIFRHVIDTPEVMRSETAIVKELSSKIRALVTVSPR